jgi:hypothetical protein
VPLLILTKQLQAKPYNSGLSECKVGLQVACRAVSATHLEFKKISNRGSVLCNKEVLAGSRFKIQHLLWAGEAEMNGARCVSVGSQVHRAAVIDEGRLWD